MKTIYSFLLSVLIFFLFGCNKNNVEPKASVTDCLVGINIEYFDVEQKGYRLLEGEELKTFLKDSMSLEIQSYIDEKSGLSIMKPQIMNVHRNVFGLDGERFERDTTIKIERHYKIKYKVPSIYGESIEELKLIFSTYHSFFTEAWYNGKEIPIIRREDIDYARDLARPPQYTFSVEEAKREAKELFYHGDLAAVASMSQIYIVLPIKKP